MISFTQDKLESIRRGLSAVSLVVNLIDEVTDMVNGEKWRGDPDG